MAPTMRFDVPIVCPKCNKIIENAKFEDIQDNDQAIRLYTCPHCGKTFSIE